MGLTLDQVDKTVGREIHLKDINLEFASGARYVVLGRTLAGKTSLVRIMAGLDPPSRGRVLIDGQDITGTSVRKRSVAMVYQQFVNYPSLSIFDNIASPLKIGGAPKDEIERRVRRVAEMLHIDHLLDRLPAELSGGQQQRTAIARALAKETDLLILDEPLVNLDYKLREELRVELRKIFEERDAIVIYTTTEPTEALMIGGNIIIMDEGRVIQTGETAEVYHSPATLKVAEVFSDPPINLIPARVNNGNVALGPTVEFTRTGHLSDLSEGDYIFGIRSNHLFLSRQGDRDLQLEAKVALSEINGSETFTHTRYGDVPLVVQDQGVFSHKIGAEIPVFVHPDRFFVYEPSGALIAAPPRMGSDGMNSDPSRSNPTDTES